MNKKYIFFITAILGIYNSADAFTPWWEQDTICRINSNNCYSSATKGINIESWDDTSKCWGKKIICAKALKNSSDNTELTKKDISNTSYVNADFDTNKLSKYDNEYCYGQRKTKSNNTQAMVNGTYVKVWCPGILDNADESTQNGEITFGTQPTCNMLKEKNYIAVIDDKQKCYGKKLSTSTQYYIDCSDSTNDKPSQLIVLNDADINAPQGNTPQTMADAKAKFQDMYKTSTDRKSVAFKNTTN